MDCGSDCQMVRQFAFVEESNTFESDAGRYESGEFIVDIVAGCYKNIYACTPADKIVEGVPAMSGFHTGRSTKGEIVENYISGTSRKGVRGAEPERAQRGANIRGKERRGLRSKGEKA
jgi:hypothetical protein